LVGNNRERWPLQIAPQDRDGCQLVVEKFAPVLPLG